MSAKKRGRAYFEARLEAAWEAYAEQVAAIAAEAREQHVVPYCDRTGTTFRAGGVWGWVFSDREMDSAPRHIKAVLSLTPVGFETMDFGSVIPPHGLAEFDTRFGHGIDRASELVDHGVATGVVKQNETWFSFGDTRLGQGRGGAMHLIRAQPALANTIETAIQATWADLATPK